MDSIALVVAAIALVIALAQALRRPAKARTLKDALAPYTVSEEGMARVLGEFE